jgi:CBS domain-containing protein
MNVASILKLKGRSVATARPSETVQDIAAKLGSRRIGAIVIVGENGHVDGIVSERDIVRVIGEQGAAALAKPVGDVMTKDVVACHESNALDELMQLMTDGRFRHLPVMEDGTLVGIVSIGDVVKNHVAEVEMEVSSMRSYLATG